MKLEIRTMSEEKIKITEDSYLKKLKEAKNVNAVLKTEFITKISAIPEDFKIFAFEGVGDKCVYYHWIKKIDPTVKYESYICGNKDKVLKLFDSLVRDLTGIGNRVYYFVDHDFDHLQGRSAHYKIFVTKKYSIENYVATAQVLDDVLNVDFHCNGEPKYRNFILEKFNFLHEKFLQITKEINFRIFCSKILKINRTEDLPSQINQIANVEIFEVTPSKFTEKDLVKIEREPTEDEISNLRHEFEKINPTNNYRGKFSLIFFIKWLEILRKDRGSENSKAFQEMSKPEFKINGAFSMETLSTKSDPPQELREFMQTIACSY